MNLYKQLNKPIFIIHYIESNITVLLTPIFAKAESGRTILLERHLFLYRKYAEPCFSTSSYFTLKIHSCYCFCG